MFDSQAEHDSNLEEGRAFYDKIFEGEFADKVMARIKDSATELDNLLYTIFYDSIQAGYIKDIGNITDEEGFPAYVLSSKDLRVLMYTAVTIGMYEQNLNHKLESMWGVDNISAE